MLLRALRGATTLEEDTTEQMEERVSTLLDTLMSRNAIAPEDIVSVFFTATDDISSTFPATAARNFGLDNVPLLGAQELAVTDALPLCVRVLLHFYTTKSPSELRPAYLEGTIALRADLVDPDLADPDLADPD